MHNSHSKNCFENDATIHNSEPTRASQEARRLQNESCWQVSYLRPNSSTMRVRSLTHSDGMISNKERVVVPAPSFTGTFCSTDLMSASLSPFFACSSQVRPLQFGQTLALGFLVPLTLGPNWFANAVCILIDDPGAAAMSRKKRCQPATST